VQWKILLIFYDEQTGPYIISNFDY